MSNALIMLYLALEGPLSFLDNGDETLAEDVRGLMDKVYYRLTEAEIKFIERAHEEKKP